MLRSNITADTRVPAGGSAHQYPLRLRAIGVNFGSPPGLYITVGDPYSAPSTSSSSMKTVAVLSATISG
jgi:hypothetical protein